MLDPLVASEGEPDLLQISGGEPTLHPRFLRRSSPRRKRRADPPRDAEHQRHPHRHRPRFCRARWPSACRASRSICNSTRCPSGAADDPRRRSAAGARRALDALDRAGISTTLVCVVRKGRQRRRDRRRACAMRSSAAACAASLFSRCRTPAGTTASTRPRPHRAVANPPRDHRSVGRVRRRRHDPAAVQSGGDLDRLRHAGRHRRSGR